MQTWQKILKSDKTQSSETVKAEIQRLEGSRQKMKADLIELESSLGDLQQDLLAELPGALDAVRAAESHISENRNKIAAIERIVRDLEIKLTEALANERARRQSEIISEISVIDEQIAETRLLIVDHFAKAAALYKNVTNEDPTRFGFEFIFNHDLTSVFGKRVSEIEADNQGSSLYLKRRALVAESDRLRK